VLAEREFEVQLTALLDDERVRHAAARARATLAYLRDQAGSAVPQLQR
jgi:hypothetical protein